MTIVHCDLAFEDDRGTIVDILKDVPFEHATLITTKAGATRGNHYHKRSTQYIFVLSGMLMATARRPGEEAVAEALLAGDLMMNEPLERHAVRALQDSTFLVLVSGPRGGEGYESDTFRENV